MLRKLAGPFPLTFFGQPAEFPSGNCLWHDDLGLVGAINRSDGDIDLRGSFMAIAQIDGAGFSRNTRSMSGRLQHNMKTGGITLASLSEFWDTVDMRVLRPVGTDPTITGTTQVRRFTVFPDGRAIIKGTTDTAIARSLYARYVGN